MGANRSFKTSLVLGLLLIGTCFCGIATAQDEVPANLTGQDSGDMLPVSLIKGRVNSQASRYMLGPGDKVSLKIRHLEKYDQSFTVRPDGFATIHPFGEFYIAGTDIRGLQEWLEEKFKFYLLEPQISVDVVEMRNAIVYISGAVRRPGTYQFLRNISSNKAFDEGMERVELTLTNVLAKAGGISDKADIDHITVLHASTGAREVFSLRELLVNGKADDIWLLPGDSVMVPEMAIPMDAPTFQLVSRSNYFQEKFPVVVLGAVTQQGEIQVDPNNNTLNAAIALAGGFQGRVSDTDSVIIQRPTNNGAYSRWTVDPKKSQLELMPGDVIYVGHSQLANVEQGLKVLSALTLPYFYTTNGINVMQQLGKD